MMMGAYRCQTLTLCAGGHSRGRALSAGLQESSESALALATQLP